MKRMGVVVDDHESVQLGSERSGPPDVATWVPNQNDQEFSGDISLSNTGDIEDASRIAPAEFQPAVDLALQDLDMDAITHSFYLDQQMAQSSLQYSQFQSPIDLSNGTLSPDTRSTGFLASYGGGVMILNSQSPCTAVQDSGTPTMYDPIFGFNSSTLSGGDTRFISDS
jgi:hypothetical protein